MTRPLLEVDLRSAWGGESPPTPRLETCKLGVTVSCRDGAGGEKAEFCSCHMLGLSRHALASRAGAESGPGWCAGVGPQRPAASRQV